MDTSIIQETALRTLAGTISFPEVVENLLRAGVEYYHVDYVALRKTFYSADGSAAVTTPITFEGLPPVAPGFDVAGLCAAILDSFCAAGESPISDVKATSMRNGFPAPLRLAIELRMDVGADGGVGSSPNSVSELRALCVQWF